MNHGLLTSTTPEWSTPQDLFDKLNMEFRFTLDPCATAENHKCICYFTAQSDGLKQPWRGERIFMNPPYGRAIGAWIKKAWESAKEGALVVCLLPSRTDTCWWHDYCIKGEVRFLKGRLRFGGGKYPAPFPSAIVIFRPQIAATGGKESV